MVRKSRARSSSLFLMELILAIFFFSAASAVCVQFFVKSHLLSRDSNALNHAVNICAGVAETVSAAESIQDAAGLLKELFPDSAFPDGDSMDLYPVSSALPVRTAVECLHVDHGSRHRFRGRGNLYIDRKASYSKEDGL